jgi:flagellar biosynthesis/type III secretory pathway protein FliH
MVAQAKKAAEEIIGKAKAEADSIRIKARQDGDLTAKREALARLQGLISDLEKEINALRASRADFLNSNLPGMMDFACAVAGKIMVSELATRPEAIAERARALLERMPVGIKVTLSANPDDIEVIERYLYETGVAGDAILPALRSDPSMEPGSLKLMSDSGRIEARLLDTLDELGSLLNDQARHRSQTGNSCAEAIDGG